MRIRRAFLLAAAIGLDGSLPAASAGHAWFADDPPLLSLESGAAQLFDRHREVFWGLECRPAFRFCHLGPWLSFGTGKHHEFYAAAGVRINLELGRGWILAPSFGGGYYNASSGLDLGFDAEFRSSVELARRLPNGHRLGLAFAHLSNGSLSDHNPGTEALGITYSFPLDFLFRRTAPAAAPQPAK